MGAKGYVRAMRRSLERSVRQSPRLREAYYRLRKRYHRARIRRAGLRARSAGERGVDAGKVVWIFCTSRSGSTWLRSMMADTIGCEVWEEPKVGQLFGAFYQRAREGQLASTNFVLGEPTREVWIPSIRNFVLDTARACNPSLKPGQYLLVKEPDGAAGAPLIMEALPESRMVLLLRDPRDVAASALDATRSWMRELAAGTNRKQVPPNRFVMGRAESYLRQMTNARRAYDAHEGPKALLRYEDLLADPLNTTKRVYASLGIPVEEERLLRSVEKHSWANVPQGEKGKGKFYRSASPGSWREDLTPAQARTVEKVTAPIIEEFYA